MNQQGNLLSDFETLTTDEWVASIEKYLKTKPYQAIFKKVEKGIDLAPFYRKDQTVGLKLAVLQKNEWKIAQAFDVNNQNSKLVNKAILKALEGGVERLRLCLEDVNPTVLEDVLDGVYLNMIELELSGKAVETLPLDWAKAVVELEKGIESKGLLCLAASSSPLQTAQLLHDLIKILPNWSCLSFQINSNEDSGISQALANGIKAAEAAFWAALENGIDKKQLANAIYFDIEVHDDYFRSIASLRALHKLWSTVLKAYDLEGNAQLLVKTTASETSDDPYWNMITASTQALSAAISLANSIEVITLNNEQPDFGNRIARNVQHLLKMESHINEIIDPAAGSYYIENYSMKISEKAWELFNQQR